MEMTDIAEMNWKRIAVGGIAPHAVSLGVLVLAIIVYSFVFTFQTSGASNQVSLDQFTILVSTQVIPVLTILLTVVAAAWVVRTVEPEMTTLHGILVGVIVAGIGLTFGALDVVMLVRFVLAILAGWLGARLGSRGQSNRSSISHET
jgi:uncharacterized protein YqgC (DUF456 family)